MEATQAEIEAPTFVEKRRASRQPLAFEVRLGWINDDTRMEYLSGQMVDISPNGLGLRTGKRIRVSALVHVDVTDRQVAAVGRVRSCVPSKDGWRSGIELIADAVQQG